MEIPLSHSLLVWDITDSCNLVCKHCCNANFLNRRSELTKQQQVEFIESICPDSRTHIHLVGGEPTVASSLNDVLKALVRRGISYSFTTNGQTVDSTTLDILLEYPPTAIVFSIEGATPEVNDQVRGQGSFALTLEQIRRVAFEFSLCERRPQLEVAITVNALNHSDIDGLLVLAQNEGIDCVNIKRIAGEGRASKNSELLLQDREWIEACESVARLLSNVHDMPSVVLQAEPFLVSYLNLRYGVSLPLSAKHCAVSASWHVAHIRSDGQPAACSSWANSPPSFDYPHVRHGFNALVEHNSRITREYREAAKKYAKDSTSVSMICQKCLFWNYCPKCAFSAMRGGPLTNSSVCMHVQPRINALVEQLSAARKVVVQPLWDHDFSKSGGHRKLNASAIGALIAVDPNSPFYRFFDAGPDRDEVVCRFPDQIDQQSKLLWLAMVSAIQLTGQVRSGRDTRTGHAAGA